MKRIIFLVLVILLPLLVMSVDYPINTGSINAYRLVLYHYADTVLVESDSVVMDSVTVLDTAVTLVDGSINTIRFNIQYTSTDSVQSWTYAIIDLSKVVIVDSSAGDISYIANNPDDFKATGFSTFDATADSVLVNMASFNAALDNDTSLVTFLRTINNALDTLRLFQGAKVGARSIVARAADADTFKILNGTTELMRMIIQHIGGEAGGDPDSSRTAVAP